MKGQIVTASFEGGEDFAPLCGLEDCECPEHDAAPRPAGTYLLIRLDEDASVGLWRVRIEREDA